jgi:hypothetical protein
MQIKKRKRRRKRKRLMTTQTRMVVNLKERGMRM